MPQFECPTCRKLTTVAEAKDAPWRPFCSQRCKMVDLGKWLDGTYRVSDPIDEETRKHGNAETRKSADNEVDEV